MGLFLQGTVFSVSFVSFQMALMRRLLAALVRIMEPPTQKQRKLMYRSAPVEVKRKATPPPTPPTDEELVYLNYFTNYCEHEDHHGYRSQYPDDFDLTFKPRGRKGSGAEQKKNEEEKEEKEEEEDEDEEEVDD